MSDPYREAKKKVTPPDKATYGTRQDHRRRDGMSSSRFHGGTWVSGLPLLYDIRLQAEPVPETPVQLGGSLAGNESSLATLTQSIE
jgi:hypothetical protein